MNRVSVNYLDRFQENIADASSHLRRLIRLHSDDDQVVAISLEGSLVGIAIAYLRFTGDIADTHLSEIVVDIALGLKTLPEACPIGKVSPSADALKLLIVEYKSSRQLLGAALSALNVLLSAEIPEARMSGLAFSDAIKHFTELLVYEDRRSHASKKDFLVFIDSFLVAIANGDEYDLDALTLPPPPAVPQLPLSKFPRSPDRSITRSPTSSAVRRLLQNTEGFERVSTASVREAWDLGVRLRRRMDLDISIRPLEQEWYMADCLREEMIEYPDYLPALQSCLGVLQDFYHRDARPEADLIESKVRPCLRSAYRQRVIEFTVDFVRGFLAEEIKQSE
ncbi:hypothetical protein SynPROS91_02412 [Synechococcus sp. PROS-9-1]|uniref:hypothetical protein n=1 Tax=Synechococcus sp. PROS-9-1 TaxID=1968775 RepID=UPI0016461A26|nr:hypothetical protein [Synechococcus sp. PROS-9-1]QNJ32762.1 hypothetical protein SynPROS91_02412 [Synechococcus sp. PROS-9-1]